MIGPFWPDVRDVSAYARSPFGDLMQVFGKPILKTHVRNSALVDDRKRHPGCECGCCPNTLDRERCF